MKRSMEASNFSPIKLKYDGKVVLPISESFPMTDAFIKTVITLPIFLPFCWQKFKPKRVKKMMEYFVYFGMENKVENV